MPEESMNNFTPRALLFVALSRYVAYSYNHNFVVN